MISPIAADRAFLGIPMRRGERAAEDGALLLMGPGQVGKTVNDLILRACIPANREGIRQAGALRVSRGPLRAALLESSAADRAPQANLRKGLRIYERGGK